MKKLLIALLALTVVGVVAFAQDAAAPAPTLALSGYLNTGIQVQKTGDSGATDSTTLIGQDSGHNRFNLAGKYAAEDWGFVFRLRVQDTFSKGESLKAKTKADDGYAGSATDAWTTTVTGTQSAVFLNRGYGYYDVFNKMVRLQAGKLGDYTWCSSPTAADAAYGNFDTKTGAQIQIMPVAGLNFGVFLPVTEAGTNSLYLTKTMFIGGTYAMDKVGDVAVGFEPQTDPKDNKTSFMWFGVEYTGMENLTAYLEGKSEGKIVGSGDPADELGAVDQESVLTLHAKAAYTMSPLGFWLVVDYKSIAKLNDTTENFSGMVFDPGVSYTIGNAEIGVDVEYAMASAKDEIIVGKKSQTGMEIAPYVTFTLGKGDIKVGGSLDTGKIAVGADGAAAASEKGVNTIYIDYVWNF